MIVKMSAMTWEKGKTLPQNLNFIWPNAICLKTKADKGSEEVACAPHLESARRPILLGDFCSESSSVV